MNDNTKEPTSEDIARWKRGRAYEHDNLIDQKLEHKFWNRLRAIFRGHIVDNGKGVGRVRPTV